MRGQVYTILDPEDTIALGGVGAGVAYTVNKFGRNAEVSTAEAVISQGGLYTYSAAATDYFLTSSDNTDAEDITIEGLDENWDLKSVTYTLSGNTPVNIGSFLRVFRAYNADSVATAGTVYVTDKNDFTAGVPDVAADIRCIVEAAKQQSEMAIYSIPRLYTGLIKGIHIEIGNAGAATTTKEALVGLYVRDFGGVFRERQVFLVRTDSSIDRRLSVPLKVSAKSDIEIRVDAVSATLDCSASFDMLVVKSSTVNVLAG